MEAVFAFGLFVAVAALLMLGFPVAFTLAGVSLWFALLGWLTGWFDPAFLHAYPSRVYGIMTNVTLMAVPLFVFMGLVLEKSRLAHALLENLAALMGDKRGGLGFAVLLVGTLLAASTGIVGATVVTLGLLALPVMLKNGYDPALSAGTVAAAGTLGQIIPPSIVLVLLGDVLSNAYQQAQLQQGIYSPQTVSVGDLFAGAIVPGLLLVGLYALYWLLVVWRHPEKAPPLQQTRPVGLGAILKSLLPPLLLIGLVLGSILAGWATPTEAAAVGGVGALLLAILTGRMSWHRLLAISRETVLITAMIFAVLLGAALFSLVFKGFGGDELVRDFLHHLPGGKYTALLLVMAVMFLLGFILDFIEITYVVLPIVGPVLLGMGFDPVWLGVLVALNLQTSFLTPPFGFALFYLRGVTDIPTRQIYRGVVPFIALQLLMMAWLMAQPGLVYWFR